MTTIAASRSLATPGDSRFDVFRRWLESAAELDRFRQFRARGTSTPRSLCERTLRSHPSVSCARARRGSLPRALDRPEDQAWFSSGAIFPEFGFLAILGSARRCPNLRDTSRSRFLDKLGMTHCSSLRRRVILSLSKDRQIRTLRTAGGNPLVTEVCLVTDSETERHRNASSVVFRKSCARVRRRARG
jgi:hypothetical protein